MKTDNRNRFASEGLQPKGNPLTGFFSALLMVVVCLGFGGTAWAADDNSIVRRPDDLPGPVTHNKPKTHVVTLITDEVVRPLDGKAAFKYWTYNGKVPGPFIRVRLGDTVEVHLKNPAGSDMPHSVDFHAVTGPGGGAVLTQTDPGKETVFTFKTLNPGLYVYHCATPNVPLHIANGMYGLILVEPTKPLPKVDKEFYVMQGEIYTEKPFGSSGELDYSVEKLAAEHPEYIVFNGAVGGLTTQYPLKAKVGDTVRIWFGVGGPNLTSSFHVIGEIFDRLYNQASLTSPPLTDVQTTSVAPGGATVVDMRLEVPGRYILVDHALSRVFQHGLMGFMIVDGKDAPHVFKKGGAK